MKDRDIYLLILQTLDLIESKGNIASIEDSKLQAASLFFMLIEKANEDEKKRIIEELKQLLKEPKTAV